MKKLPIILVISLLLISLAPACVATRQIRLAPIQGPGYHIEEAHYSDRGNSLVVWGVVKNTSGRKYHAIVNAWVTENKGYGNEIARYSRSLGHLDEGEALPFAVSFRLKDAEIPLSVSIDIDITTL